ncbi:MAG TPA: BMP family protein [Anaerolineaceae bacterium]|nr:BMP family protein [Anaerolineaceae bacterium]HQP07987.1 BMP family protein [Anaerolineaceae bacterium]
MKKGSMLVSLLVIVFTLLLSACGSTPEQPVEIEVTRIVAGTPEVIMITPTPEVVEVKPFRVAIVMPSSITDAAFSQSMYEGLLAVQEEMGGPEKMEIAYSEGMFNVPDAASAVRDYASQGFDLVIAHGSQYGSSLQQIAPEFPETSFAWGTSLDTFQADGITNVFAYQAEAQEGGYALGVLAAFMSKSGIMGVCGPVEAGDAKLYVDGFVTGATVQNPNATVQKTYTGSFSDVALMASAAETHIQAGADMLTGSSQSVVGAIGIAKDNGAYWFGTQWDQTALAPETVVASQVYDWTGVIKDMIASRQAGVLGNKSYTLTFKNGGLVIQYNPAIDVPADAKAAVDAAIAGIMDGTIDPLKGPVQ